jgi:hypothetical protein
MIRRPSIIFTDSVKLIAVVYFSGENQIVVNFSWNYELNVSKQKNELICDIHNCTISALYNITLFHQVLDFTNFG